MIQFRTGLGNMGRWGNSLYQLAFVHSMAKKYDTTYEIPKWKYSDLFVNKFNEVDELTPATFTIKEPHYRYTDFSGYGEMFKHNVVDVVGYFQNIKYFDPEEIRNLFTFKPEIVQRVREKYKDLLSKPTIAVGVRRTDYTTTGNYYQLPVTYYALALQKFDWKNSNIIFISDDLEWCKFHFQCLDNAYFPEFESDIEQFIFGCQVKNWITANSTFHWWAAFLSQPEKVIQPKQLFDGKLLAKEGDYNFYIEGGAWEIFDHKKINLTDVTFTIPVNYDSDDRKKNLELIISLLQQNFNTNILVGEQGGTKFEYVNQWVKYMNFDYPEFHRTKMLNNLALAATTPIIANWDCDVMVSPMQILKSVELIREGKADMVYPYEYLFVRLPKKTHERIFPQYDMAVFKDIKDGADTLSAPSVGGAVFFDRERFFEGGGENEAFVSFCPEDVERYERFKKLGYKIMRVKGDLYHFNHWCGPNSSLKNPHYTREPLNQIRKLSREELRAFVNNWPWAKQYSPEYRLEISPTAERSAREVLSVLNHMGVFTFDSSVIDFGSGVGSWGVGLSDYTAVDFNVPHEMVLVENYINHDLRTPFVSPKYDLVISCEVAEHLQEKYADTLIDTICNAAKEYILFSAAIPNQGGHNHHNERWPSYWAEKFRQRGFFPFYDDIRKLLYDNENVDLWYRNNLILFSRTNYGMNKLDFVHPKYYEQITNHLRG